jgi:hypothetical protein
MHEVRLSLAALYLSWNKKDPRKLFGIFHDVDSYVSIRYIL